MARSQRPPTGTSQQRLTTTLAILAIALDVTAIPFFFAMSAIAVLFFVFTLLGLIFGVLAVASVPAPHLSPRKRILQILCLLIPGANIYVLSAVPSAARLYYLVG